MWSMFICIINSVLLDYKVIKHTDPLYMQYHCNKDYDEYRFETQALANEAVWLQMASCDVIAKKK